ncbi:MAG: hypothetical protein CO098_17375 [Bacteroidetes bacterium CG_4_9_14_3_um_filter_41_19]|nr:MAG: hypothetical protein CO098_17375 [Bacteroidetes bacterium CG_4_9_14_3_um_filter_41_19]
MKKRMKTITMAIITRKGTMVSYFKLLINVGVNIKIYPKVSKRKTITMIPQKKVENSKKLRPFTGPK